MSGVGPLLEVSVRHAYYKQLDRIGKLVYGMRQFGPRSPRWLVNERSSLSLSLWDLGSCVRNKRVRVFLWDRNEKEAKLFFTGMASLGELLCLSILRCTWATSCAHIATIAASVWPRTNLEPGSCKPNTERHSHIHDKVEVSCKWRCDPLAKAAIFVVSKT